MIIITSLISFGLFLCSLCVKKRDRQAVSLSLSLYAVFGYNNGDLCGGSPNCVSSIHTHTHCVRTIRRLLLVFPSTKYKDFWDGEERERDRVWSDVGGPLQMARGGAHNDKTKLMKMYLCNYLELIIHSQKASPRTTLRKQLCNVGLAMLTAQRAATD